MGRTRGPVAGGFVGQGRDATQRIQLHDVMCVAVPRRWKADPVGVPATDQLRMVAHEHMAHNMKTCEIYKICKIYIYIYNIKDIQNI